MNHHDHQHLHLSLDIDGFPEIHGLPRPDEMLEYEKIFYAKCQLDRNGKRTKIPRPQRCNASFITEQNAIWIKRNRKKRKLHK